jgi:hypothetical protein
MQQKPLHQIMPRPKKECRSKREIFSVYRDNPEFIYALSLNGRIISQYFLRIKIIPSRVRYILPVSQLD